MCWHGKILLWCPASYQWLARKSMRSCLHDSARDVAKWSQQTLMQAPPQIEETLSEHELAIRTPATAFMAVCRIACMKVISNQNAAYSPIAGLIHFADTVDCNSHSEHHLETASHTMFTAPTCCASCIPMETCQLDYMQQMRLTAATEGSIARRKQDDLRQH